MLLLSLFPSSLFFFFPAEDGIRALYVTGVQTCALPISLVSTTARPATPRRGARVLDQILVVPGGKVGRLSLAQRADQGVERRAGSQLGEHLPRKRAQAASQHLGARQSRPRRNRVEQRPIVGVDVELHRLADLGTMARSEEHTSELQSRRDLVCR